MINNITTSAAAAAATTVPISQGMKHWSQKKHESVIASHCVNSKTNQFLIKIKGGSDSGQFIYFDSSLHTVCSSSNGDKNNNN